MCIFIHVLSFYLLFSAILLRNFIHASLTIYAQNIFFYFLFFLDSLYGHKVNFFPLSMQLLLAGEYIFIDVPIFDCDVDLCLLIFLTSYERSHKVSPYVSGDSW